MANGQTITRRGILKAAPAAMVIGAGAAVASAIPAEDPILAPYRRWWAAYTEFARLSGTDIPWESPEMVALSDARDEAREQIEDMEPLTMEGIAAVAHVAWATDAMPWAEGSEEYLKEAEQPFCKMLAAIWRCASGATGLPAS